MQLKMQARHLWDTVKFADADYDDDRSALDAICSGVPAEMIPILVAKESAKDSPHRRRPCAEGNDTKPPHRVQVHRPP